jgi:hypothetical protein
MVYTRPRGKGKIATLDSIEVRRMAEFQEKYKFDHPRGCKVSKFATLIYTAADTVTDEPIA